MDRIITKTKDWKRTDGNKIDTGAGVFLGVNDQKQVCSYYGVPASLLNVDKKFNTNTFVDVMHAVADEVEVMVDQESNNHHVLDPKSVFVDDESFTSITELVGQSADVNPVETQKGLSKVLEFTLQDKDTDNFLGDVFKRKVRVERLPQGGLSLNTAALRLACTNGMVVADSQYSKTIREGATDHPTIAAFVDAVQNLNMDEYLRLMFTKDGRPIDATVADFINARTTILQLSKNAEVEGDKGDEALVDTLFPMSVIEDFYAGQGIDFKTINNKLLERLPAGMQYQQLWNIMTNAAKHLPDTLDTHIKIAQFVRPSRMRQINLVTPEFNGMPQWTDSYDVRRLMGDLV